MKRLFLLGLLFSLPGAAWAQELGPEELVKKITSEVMTAEYSSAARATP